MSRLQAYRQRVKRPRAECRHKRINPEKLAVKASLVLEIARAIHRLELTQEAAGQRMGLSQPKVSDILRGELANVSERKLMDCLNRLGYDIEIRVKPATDEVGRLLVAIA